MFDTHCHLNFKAFKKILPEIITSAQEEGVANILIPGTDVKTSKDGIFIAEQYDWMYVAVGIHPHHVMKYLRRYAEPSSASANEIPDLVRNDVKEIESLLHHPKVKAVGEIGLDKHVYEQTVYEEYNVDGAFIELQKELFKKQLHLALEYDKSLILHNREAIEDLIPILKENWDDKLKGKTVLHCCEPLEELLSFAKEHQIYMGVDGDITFIEAKQQFITQVPAELLVLETDSPFLLPEPLRSQKKYPNKPANIKIVAETVAKLRNIPVEELIEQTSENAKRLFSII